MVQFGDRHDFPLGYTILIVGHVMIVLAESGVPRWVLTRLNLS